MADRNRLYIIENEFEGQTVTYAFDHDQQEWVASLNDGTVIGDAIRDRDVDEAIADYAERVEQDEQDAEDAAYWARIDREIDLRREGFYDSFGAQFDDDPNPYEGTYSEC